MKPIIPTKKPAQAIASKAARERARPILAAWIAKVKQKVRERKMIPVDLLLAELLINYPSANFGTCWAGQARHAAQLGLSLRTIQRSLLRFKEEGLLKQRRGGPGKTSCWTLCADGKRIFAILDPPKMAGLDATKMAGLDATKMAAKPFEQDPSENDPPPNPPVATVVSFEAERARRHTGAVADDQVEVLGPGVTFEEFWEASGAIGKAGPAIAAWRRLSEEDRLAIGRLVEDGNGSLDLEGMWAAVWLTSRRWNQPRLPNARDLCIRKGKKAGEQEPNQVATPTDVPTHWVDGEDPAWPDWCRANNHAPTLKDSRGGWYFARSP